MPEVLRWGEVKRDMEQISPELVLNPRPGATDNTYTLASLLGHMLTLAEREYGPRHGDYVPLGVEFSEGPPHIWFPGNCGHVVVVLGRECMTDPARACFQLAQEVPHLLSPTGTARVNVLEEGIATRFTEWFMREEWPRLGWERTSEPYSDVEAYVAAKEAVETLLAADGEAIRKLRRRQPVISRVTAGLIRKVVRGVASELAEELAGEFVG